MFRNIPPVTKNLIIINLLIWLACETLRPFGAVMDRSCGLHYFLSPDFRFWQPLTYMFLHGGMTHVLFNMFAVLMFGSVIERVFGSARYLLFYLTVGIGAALVQEGVYAIWLAHLGSQLPEGTTLSEIARRGYLLFAQGQNWLDPVLGQANALINTPTVGASGAVFGILLAFAMIFPNMPMYIMFVPIPVKAKWLVLGYGALELFLGVTGLQSGVAHFAHLGGMLIGWALIVYWRKKGEINNDPLY